MIASFDDRLGRFFESIGMPRTAGRVLARLLTCDPPEQDFEALVKAVKASRSTVSVVTRLLVDLGLIERFSVAGDRKDRYRVPDGAWEALLRKDIETARQLRELANEGLASVKKKPRSVQARLRGMRAFYEFLEGEYAPLVKRWQRRRR
ncbi:MAG: hypothetical protein QM817_12610 [Archangium sp.]